LALEVLRLAAGFFADAELDGFAEGLLVLEGLLDDLAVLLLAAGLAAEDVPVPALVVKVDRLAAGFAVVFPSLDSSFSQADPLPLSLALSPAFAPLPAFAAEAEEPPEAEELLPAFASVAFAPEAFAVAADFEDLLSPALAADAAEDVPAAAAEAVAPTEASPRALALRVSRRSSSSRLRRRSFSLSWTAGLSASLANQWR